MKQPTSPTDPVPEGLQKGPSSRVPAREGDVDAHISEMERSELKQRLRKLRRKGKRHLLWAFLGVSPGALLPALGLMREGSEGLLLLLGGLVVITQLISYGKVSREAEALEDRLSLPPSS